MAKAKKSYPVTFSHDGTWWVAEVTSGIDGCSTQGRMIESARSRLREAIQAALDLNEPYAGDFEETFAVPAKLDARLGKLREARKHMTELEENARTLTRSVVGDLLGMGMSVRDAGELVGVSHARVHQLAQELRTERTLATKRPAAKNMRDVERLLAAKQPATKNARATPR